MDQATLLAMLTSLSGSHSGGGSMSTMTLKWDPVN